MSQIEVPYEVAVKDGVKSEARNKTNQEAKERYEARRAEILERMEKMQQPDDKGADEKEAAEVRERAVKKSE